MRLQHLQLIRYGKFTDAEMALPKAENDFHFIVGPNEAGKSTVRTAIAELLFGFPLRSGAMAFLHHQSELRLGANVADESHALDFVRTKANKGTLRSLADVALPDDSLAAFLGTADREFFEQMFGSKWHNPPSRNLPAVLFKRTIPKVNCIQNLFIMDTRG